MNFCEYSCCFCDIILFCYGPNGINNDVTSESTSPTNLIFSRLRLDIVLFLNLVLSRFIGPSKKLPHSLHRYTFQALLSSDTCQFATRIAPKPELSKVPF